jgi:hypothetical protein
MGELEAPRSKLGLIESPERPLEILNPCHRGVPGRTERRVGLRSLPRGGEVDLDRDALYSLPPHMLIVGCPLAWL